MRALILIFFWPSYSSTLTSSSMDVYHPLGSGSNDISSTSPVASWPALVFQKLILILLFDLQKMGSAKAKGFRQLVRVLQNPSHNATWQQHSLDDRHRT